MTRRRAAIVLVPVAGLVALWLAPDLSRYSVADPARVFLDSLFYSASAIVLVLVLVVGARLGAPTLARDVAIAAVASLVLLPIGYAAVVFVNGRLDTAPATEHSVRLVRAAADGRLEVESWRSSGDVQRLPRRWRALAAAPGSLVMVTTRPGWLGHEWVTGARVVPPLTRVVTARTAAPVPWPPPAAPADEKVELGDAVTGEAHRKRAYAHAMRREMGNALVEYDRAIAAEPRNAENYYRRAVTRKDTDQVDAAIADLRKALELDPRHVGAHWELATLYAFAGEFPLSQLLVEELARLSPADGEVQVARAWHFARQKNHAAELEALRRGCQLGSPRACERQHASEARR